MYSQRFNLIINSIDADNGLVPNKQQAIILTSDSRVNQCIIASFTINELNDVFYFHNFVVSKFPKSLVWYPLWRRFLSSTVSLFIVSLNQCLNNLSIIKMIHFAIICDMLKHTHVDIC